MLVRQLYQQGVDDAELPPHLNERQSTPDFHHHGSNRVGVLPSVTQDIE